MRKRQVTSAVGSLVAAAMWVAAATAAGSTKDGKIWADPPAGQAKPLIGMPSLAPIAEKLTPAVVSIVVEQALDPGAMNPMLKFFGDLFGPLPEGFESQGEGSGIVIDPSGYILTNAHVIEGATSIRVVLSTGVEAEAAVVGVDLPTDVAVIKIPASGLAVAPLGDSDKVEVGDWVVAIGSPFGLQATLTAGVVSAMGRQHVGPEGEQLYEDFIQTDAPINPGSSGGPLVDLAGSVVGLNTAINAAGQGIAFAIPINMVKVLIPDLVKKGKFDRSWLGVVVQEVTPAISKALGMDGQGGALVSEVESGSPAAAAGLEAGDVILEFDGKAVGSVGSLSWLASTAGAGKKAKILFWRDGKEAEAEAVLAAKPAAAGAGAAAAIGEDDGGAKKKKNQKKDDPGIGLQAMDQGTATALGLAAVDGKLPGLLVVSIDPGSKIAAAGIERGDVILEVGGKTVFDPKDVLGPVKKAKGGDVVLMYVVSHGSKRFVAFAP